MLVAGLTLGVLVASPGRAAATGTETPPTEPLKVLVVGDSISQGFGGDSTWRYWFWREAARQGVAIDFVGPDRLPRLGRYESKDLSFDRDHAALAGSTIGYHRRRIDALMATYQPAVVVVELGINDVRAGRSGATVAADLERLVGRIWSQDRATRVVLAELPVYPRDPAMDAAAVETNHLLADAYGDDPRVTRVHNRTDRTQPDLRWDPRRFTYDGLHPNAAGQTLLGQRFAEAFQRAGVLPMAPQVYRDRTWHPNVVPAVRRSGHRVTVDWSAALDEVKLGSVRVVFARRTGRTLAGQSWFTAGAGRMTRTLARGTYDVRLIPVRGTMTGVASPRVTVRVP